MAFFDTTWYVSSVGWSAITAWSTGTAKTAGALIRQNATPSVGSERVFVCIVAGTTHATTEPTWTVTRGAKTTDNASITWQECTGASAINGDLTNTPAWTSVKNTAITLGAIIKRDNAASYQICSTAGTAGNGSEPAFSNTAGTTTADNTVTWTSLGAVGNFTGGQGPAARLEIPLATTWTLAGNTVYVKSDHAATRAAAITFSGAGTIANPIKVLCHDGGAYPPLSANLTTGAVETTTGANAISWGVGGAGAATYYRGIEFHSGTSGLSTNSSLLSGTTNPLIIFDTCSIQVLSTSQSFLVLPASGGGKVKFINTTTKWGATTSAISPVGLGGVNLEWKNSTVLASGSSVPAALFKLTTANASSTILIEGCDLSGITSGNTIVDNNSVLNRYDIKLKDCKLASGVIITNSSTSLYGAQVDLIRCDSGAANTRNERYRIEGTETTELTIVRTGGATDGTTSHARKIVTSASASFVNPFEAMPISVWNELTSSITLTIYGIAATMPNNDEFWIEAEYLGSGSTPQGSLISSRKADILATAAALTSDGSTWGGSTTAFSTSVTFTPGMKGPITVRIFAAKVSSTFYYDPKAVLT